MQDLKTVSFNKSVTTFLKFLELICSLTLKVKLDFFLKKALILFKIWKLLKINLNAGVQILSSLG